jgi:SAM-dependent methyltransferase
MTCSPYAGEIAIREKIPNHLAPDYVKATQRHLRYAEARLGRALPPGARILDFGCGIGNSVKLLLDLGYDAYGVDVLEYWDRDLEKYWHAARKPPTNIATRLKLVDLSDYRLPFEDCTFDLCFSDQVFEHIFDYRTTMSEIVRVLKPGAASLHCFPGPNNLIEGHIHLPVPWLCYSRSYLALWALASWLRGTEPDWRGRVASQLDSMRFNNYPTKRRLRRIAQSAGVQISFAEVDEFLFREGSAAKTAILSALRRVKLDRLATHIAAPFMLQRYMILRAQSARRM